MAVLDWFRRRKQPLTGVPGSPRTKTYTAETGHVYRYRFLGKREVERPGGRGTEYVFAAAAGRKSEQQVSVFLPLESVESWEEAHGRALGATECYAIAKMALFQAFDEREPGRMGAEIRVRPADASAILETLGLD